MYKVPSSLVRRGASASALGTELLGAQWALSFALAPAQGTSDPWETYNPLLFGVYNVLLSAALLLFAAWLVGHHSQRARHSGWPGRVGKYLALSAGALAIVGIVAALVVGPQPGFSVLLVPFTQLPAVFCLIASLGLLSIATTRAAALQDWISGLRWHWVLLILAVGLGAALLSDVLETVMTRDIPGLSIKGTHVLHVLITIPAAIWVARRFSTAPVLNGVLVGLVSGVINQIYFHVLNGTLRLSEVAIILPLSIMAGWLGGIIGQATLIEQDTLYRASQAIGEASDLQNVVSAIGKHLADPQVSHVALWQDVSRAEDDESVEISLLAVWMPWVAQVWGPGAWRPGLRLDATRVPALASLQRESPLLLQTRKLPSSERAMWEHQGIRSAILLPLIAPSGAKAGLLMVASRRYGFSRARVRTYLTIGAQVALVLENLRLIEQAQQTGVSNERQRLAQEIHDTLAQSFTSIVIRLEAAEEALPSVDLISVQRFLDQARGIARESLTEARRLMWALRPESLERSSLSEALAGLAKRWSEECSINASTSVVGTTYPLTPDTETTLLRVAQEALTNCRKYSQARQVTLTLSYMNNLVALNVQDDGVGFDLDRRHLDSSDQSTGGYGLVGMRERVEQLRGTLVVESAPGEGTTLMVAIPVAPDKQAAGGTEAINATPTSQGDDL